MKEIDKKYIGHDSDVRPVHLITGVTKLVGVNGIVGYCNSYLHRGYLTKSLMDKHGCLEKKCQRFHKFEDYPYWKNKKREAEKKKREKQSRRDERKAEEKRKEYFQRKYDEILYTAIRCVRHFRMEAELLKIVSRSKRVFVIPYGSQNNYDDSRDFDKIVSELRRIYGVKVIFKHMKDLNGRYLTVYDVRRVKIKNQKQKRK